MFINHRKVSVKYQSTQNHQDVKPLIDSSILHMKWKYTSLCKASSSSCLSSGVMSLAYNCVKQFLILKRRQWSRTDIFKLNAEILTMPYDVLYLKVNDFNFSVYQTGKCNNESTM